MRKPFRLYSRKKKLFFAGIVFFFVGNPARAQFSISAQLRARSEFRDGQGAPLPSGAQPAFFTSQRSRLTTRFTTNRLKLGITLQDVRVWGQDVSTINRVTTQNNNGLMLHEAWADVALTDSSASGKMLSLKLGRQELVYDDQRLLGNLDWLQQGRRHDAAVLKYTTPAWMIHLGSAYNQNKEKSSGTSYNATPPDLYTATTNGGTMYKSLEYLYAARKLKKGSLSFLFLTDQFNAYDSVMLNNIAGINYTDKTWARATTGLYFLNAFGRLDLTASAYYQFGKNGRGAKTNGQLLSIGGFYNWSKLSAGAGADYTSPGFDPLYGTAHKFWGLMDYFYAANPFGGHGLVDYYVKAKLRPEARTEVTLDLHHFTSATIIPGYSKAYGKEIDLVASYAITKDIGLEGGYSHFFATDALASTTVKNIQNARPDANWAYVMLNIKPEFIFKN